MPRPCAVEGCKRFGSFQAREEDGHAQSFLCTQHISDGFAICDYCGKVIMKDAHFSSQTNEQLCEECANRYPNPDKLMPKEDDKARGMVEQMMKDRKNGKEVKALDKPRITLPTMYGEHFGEEK